MTNVNKTLASLSHLLNCEDTIIVATQLNSINSLSTPDNSFTETVDDDCREDSKEFGKLEGEYDRLMYLLKKSSNNCLS